MSSKHGPLTRRAFLKRMAALAGGLVLGGLSHRESAPAEAAIPQTSPPRLGIEHVILVMMENRSFDHFLGWLPGANGRQAGLSYPDPSGVLHSTYALAPDYQGCAHPDPDHSYTGGRIEYDGGKCDGWLLDPNNDIYSIGYYTQQDLAFLGAQAPAWTSFDNYFAAIMAETYPNRIYQHAAQTDRLTNTTTLCTLPTIWDRLAAAGLSGRYYFSDVPFLALWGSKYASISRTLGNFITDCESGNLPQVAFVDPRFLDENSGTSGDDHPHGDIRSGESFLSTVYNAVRQSPAWSSTVLIINFDEWGGFFDHVAPSAAPIPSADQAAGNQDGLRGFRVPSLVISPWSRRGYVSHTLYDHTSVLRLIEWRWKLKPLTVRDATANNLAAALDLSHPNLSSPSSVVPPFTGAPCAAGSPPVDTAWPQLATLAANLGFPTP